MSHRLRLIVKIIEGQSDGQREIIDMILQQQDGVIVMPTGGGKTLCFAIPAVLTRGVTVVHTPLLALMGDQVQRLRRRGLNAFY